MNVYVVLAFGSALAWINIIADELVALLTALGIILEIDSGILGLTVLAMGNSLGDMAANLSVARGGYPNMAVTACYVGPFFNVCIGIGVSFLTVSLSSPVHEIDDQHRKDMKLPTTLFVSCAWLILALCMTLATAILFKYQLPRTFGYMAVGAYGVFIGVIVLQKELVPTDKQYFSDWAR